MSGHETVMLTEEENRRVTGWSAVFMFGTWSLAALSVLAFAAGAAASPENLWKIQTALSPYALVYGVGVAVAYVARKHLLTKAVQTRTIETITEEKQQWQNQHKN